MAKKSLLINTFLSAVLFCSGVTLAQDPVQDIDKKLHPNMATAQALVAQANAYIKTAQQDNRYDLNGHAQKARELLVQVNYELRHAADDANANAHASQQKK
jgi:hypothetical protein